MKLEDLKKRIPFKWRVQSYSKNKPLASCVAYIDARDVMDLLDEVCGPENWQDKYYIAGESIICSIGIFVKKSVLERESDGWVWKSDTGTSGSIEKEKSIISDAFKRAAVKWGIGRFLYDMKIEYLDTNEKNTGNNYPYPINPASKQRIWDITEYINSKTKYGK